MDAGYFVEVGGALPNKLGIDDPEALQNAEYDLVAKNISKVIQEELPKKFDFGYLLDLHRQLFGEIYDFAGKPRTVNISKPDSPAPFCYSDFIEPEANRIFSELERESYFTKLNQPQFVEKLAWLSSELNALHPFREGNGRTTRLSLSLLAKNAGYFVDFNLASRRAILYADAEAFAGNLAPLKNLYRQIVEKI